MTTATVQARGPLDAHPFAGPPRGAQLLPSYAQPRFVCILKALPTTSTLKLHKAQLTREVLDPGAVSQPLFVRTQATYSPLTGAV